MYFDLVRGMTAVCAPFYSSTAMCVPSASPTITGTITCGAVKFGFITFPYAVTLVSDETGARIIL